MGRPTGEPAIFVKFVPDPVIRGAADDGKIRLLERLKQEREFHHLVTREPTALPLKTTEAHLEFPQFKPVDYSNNIKRIRQIRQDRQDRLDNQNISEDTPEGEM